jgi:hypothetical protein
VPIINQQQLDGTCIIRSAANETFAIADFQTDRDTSLDVAVNSVSIRKIIWSTDGHIVIGRVVSPSSNLVMFHLQYSGSFDLDALGLATSSPSDYPDKSLYVTHDSANSTVVIKVKKKTAPSSEWNNEIVEGLPLR